METIRNTQPPMPPQMTEKRRFSNALYFPFGGLLIYEGIMYVIVIAVMIVQVILDVALTIIQGNEIDTDALLENITQSGVGLIAGVMGAVAFLIFFFRKRLKLKEIFSSRKKISAFRLTALIFVLLGIQLPVVFFEDGFEKLLNLIGFSAKQAIEASGGSYDTLSMILYISIVAPVVEEILFRGFMMQTLEKFNVGRGFSIIISSVLFGAIHANLTQSIFAVAAGVVFAYTASEYGVKWSIVLHAINNTLMGTVLTLVTDRMDDKPASILSYGLMTLFFVGAIVIAAIKHKAAKSALKEIFGTEKKYYAWTFSNPLMLIFLIINFLMALLIIEKL